jgi:cobalt-zinc-cadmium efflux system protein
MIICKICRSEDGHAHSHSSGECGHGHGQHHDHGHGHSHDDDHHHGADDDAGGHSSALANKSWRYWFVLVFQLGFCLAELVVAILTRSLALLSEAFHNIGDVVSLLIAMYVERVKGGARTDAFSFGMRRAEVVGAMLNGTALLALCFFVVLEAIPRFFQPVGTNSICLSGVVAVACCCTGPLTGSIFCMPVS